MYHSAQILDILGCITINFNFSIHLSISEALSQALPEPPAPLPRQKYFHGSISRIEAEALLDKDGQFLIRESSKRPGQYVLTGMAKGQPQHLLLMDKEGKVRSCD